MTRRLVLFGLMVCAAAVFALVAPLFLAARDSARAAALADAQGRAQETAVLVAGSTPGNVERLWSAAPPGAGSLGVVLPDGGVVGDDPGEGAEPAVAAARNGHAVSVQAGSDVVVASPAQGPAGAYVVLVRLTPYDLTAGLGATTLAFVAAGLVLLGAAAAGAVFLARRTAEPITHLAEVADRMADGDLEVRVEPSGVPEVEAVGHALNRLAGRVGELLQEERRSTADLAHRLRTPITALSVDLDAVGDPDVAGRLRDDLLTLQTGIDEIIRSARRPEREGLLPTCDAAEVVARRTSFWRVLAEDQRRPFNVNVAPGPLPVRLTRADLEAAVDVALQNVFVHTPEGIALRVAVSQGSDGRGARVVVEDSGPGWSAEPARRPGTTGLGLDIAARTAEASGGGLRRETTADGGARVVLVLGAPDQA